jgi:hypothetical protein
MKNVVDARLVLSSHPFVKQRKLHQAPHTMLYCCIRKTRTLRAAYLPQATNDNTKAAAEMSIS